MIKSNKKSIFTIESMDYRELRELQKDNVILQIEKMNDYRYLVEMVAKKDYEASIKEKECEELAPEESKSNDEPIIIFEKSLDELLKLIFPPEEVETEEKNNAQE